MSFLKLYLMSIIEFFDNMEMDDFLWMSLAFIILFVAGFVIGFVAEFLWIVILAAIIAGIFVIWSFLYVYANWREWRKEKEILVELPSFPQKDFCDICGKELEGAEKKTDGEFLIYVCPHCDAENIVSSEQKIQEVEKAIEEVKE